MSFKIFRIALMIVLAGLALSSAARATCSNASLSGTYGFLHTGTDAAGEPTTTLTQITFDPTTATFNTVDIASHNGVINPESSIGTYAVASDCTAENQFTIGGGIAFVVTSTGFFAGAGPHKGVTVDGFGVKQGSPTCTNAGVEGNFGFEATGFLVAGAPGTRPVAFIGELELTVNTSGEGVISGHMAGSDDGTILTFADEPVTGSYSIDADCWGTATITPKGRSVMHFKLVLVDGGKEVLAIQTDGGTVVSGALQR